eukprot:364602-Chlamydomonas_euryale.AAC.15
MPFFTPGHTFTPRYQKPRRSAARTAYVMHCPHPPVHTCTGAPREAHEGGARALPHRKPQDHGAVCRPKAQAR